MEHILHGLDTVVMLGVSPSGIFNLSIYVGVKRPEKNKPIESWQFESFEVFEVLQDLAACIQHANNPTLIQAYHRAIDILESPDTHELIATISGEIGK